MVRDHHASVLIGRETRQTIHAVLCKPAPGIGGSFGVGRPSEPKRLIERTA
jgi:hypothetical protein